MQRTAALEAFGGFPKARTKITGITAQNGYVKNPVFIPMVATSL